MHQVERLEADEGKLDDFVNKTVPRTVDEQSGAVTRKLQKAQETFDIENAKIQKREQKVRWSLRRMVTWPLHCASPLLGQV